MPGPIWSWMEGERSRRMMSLLSSPSRKPPDQEIRTHGKELRGTHLDRVGSRGLGGVGSSSKDYILMD